MIKFSQEVDLKIENDHIVFEIEDFSQENKKKTAKDIEALLKKARRVDKTNAKFARKIEKIEDAIAENEEKIEDLEFDIEDQIYKENSEIGDEDFTKELEKRVNEDAKIAIFKKALEVLKKRKSRVEKEKKEAVDRIGYADDAVDLYFRELLSTRIKDKEALKVLFKYGKKWGYKKSYDDLIKQLEEGNEKLPED